MSQLAQGKCQTDLLSKLVSVNDRLLNNPEIRHLKRRLLDINTTLSYHLKNYEQALKYLEQNSQHKSSPDLMVSRLEILLADGREEEAKLLLAEIKDIIRHNSKSQLYYLKRLEAIERKSRL